MFLSMQELIGKINIGLGQVRTQLQTAAASAHEENRRNFEEQEQRIQNLYEDVDGIVTKLNTKLEETIRSYMGTSQGVDQAKSMDAGMDIN